MNPKINPKIRDFPKLSYAKETAITASAVDCSAGYNPYGAPAGAVAALRELTLPMVFQYPHGQEFKDAVVDFWKPYAALSPQNIVHADGTIDGIYYLNALFAAPGACVLAVAPQFSDYITHAQFMGIAYRPLYLDAETGYRIEIPQLLEHIDSSLSLVYLDNPNNPTGQIVSLEGLEQLVAKALAHNVCVIVDEAYGDFVDESLSAVSLLPRYENLIILRTFSKGLGLGGLRAGYILASQDICENLEKINNPYTISQPSRMAAIAALQDPGFIRECRENIAASKGMLRDNLGNNLRMCHTEDSCPICVISHVDPSVDLEQAFLERGILVYSGSNFDGLGRNSVRLRVPHRDQCGALFDAARAIGQ